MEIQILLFISYRIIQINNKKIVQNRNLHVNRIYFFFLRYFYGSMDHSHFDEFLSQINSLSWCILWGSKPTEQFKRKLSGSFCVQCSYLQLNICLFYGSNETWASVHFVNANISWLCLSKKRMNKKHTLNYSNKLA